jgi:phosphoserine aminotransferase
MIHNFSAGPGVLPQKVLEKVKSELLSFNNCGVSVLELSHRSKEFKAIISNAERDFRKLLSIPDNYKVLFMQGVASNQFSAVLYNLVVDDKPIDYIITGQWSCKAYKEAVRMGCNAHVSFNISQGPFDATKLSFSTNPQFIYYCDNETVDGFELPVNVVDSFPNSTIVCDMSSNFMSRKFDVSRYGVIFGGAQKNIGPAGVTIVIVREDLLGLFEKSPLSGPLMLDYKLCADNGSLYNTPPTFSIYVSGLVFDHVLSLGKNFFMQVDFNIWRNITKKSHK